RRGSLSDAVGSETDFLAEDRAGGTRNRREGEFIRGLAFRPTEMGKQDHLCSLVGKLPDRRHDTLDASGVSDLPILHGHIEIDAHQNALARYRRQIVKCPEAAHPSSPL